MQNFFTVALPLLATVTTNTAILPFSEYKLQGPPPPVEVKPFSIIKEFDTEKTAILEVAPEKPKEKRLICKDCNENENYVFNALKTEGIFDKNAIATVMANIKQESGFIPNICEGGSRVPYHRCNGGMGILQWTNGSRYYGLGNFAKKYGGDPSTLETQVRYMFYENDWKVIKNEMKRPGAKITDYQRLAYKWIRYGHKGPREYYAYQYLKRFQYETL